MVWYNPSWIYRVKITVLAAKVSTDLTDFPVYVDLSELPAGFHSHCNQTDARDIRVTEADGETEVPREVVSYDADSDAGELHFLGDIDGDTDTDFYIYYGNAGASDYADDAEFGAENVWDSNFKAVYHMDGGASATIEDSTDNDNDGSKEGDDANEPEEETGKVGKAQVFELANNEYIDCGGVVHDADNDNLTTSVWIKPNMVDSSTGMGYLGHRGNAGLSLVNVGWRPLTSRELAVLTLFGRFDQVSDGYDPDLSNDTWYHVAVTYNKVNVIFYLNGSLLSSHAKSDEVKVSDYNMYIGAVNNNGVASNPVNGSLDEVRISDFPRSADWISTEYNNQNSPATFFTIGEEVPSMLSISPLPTHLRT